MSLVRRGRPALVLICGMGMAARANADFSLTIERNRVDVGDSVAAAFTYDGDTDGQSPDFTPLTKDFEIRATSTLSRHQIVNGVGSASVQWLLSLAPRHAGTLLIPSITFHNERSGARQLEVLPLDPRLSGQLQRMVFFTSDVRPDKPYVQAQLTYTRRLYYTGDAQLYGDLPGKPDIADVIVQPLAAPSPGTEVRDGVTYDVVEQRFALFPQASGELVIPAAAIQSSARARNGRRSQVTVESAATHVHVLARPESYPTSAAWLPAHALTVSEATGAPVATATVGDAIVRTIVVTAAGLSATALPGLPLPQPENAKVYAAQPQFAESSDGRYITGTRTETITWVPTQPGPMTLPAIALTWWDVDQGMQRTATLPRRVISVVSSGAQVPAGSPLPTAGSATAAAARLSGAAAPRRPVAGRDDAAAATSAVRCLALAASIAASAGIAAGGWLWSLRRARRARAVAAATDRPPPATRRADVARACIANDPALARRALGAWLAARWHTSAQAALAAIAEQPVIAALNAAVFAGTAQPWHGRALRDWLQRAPADAPAQKTPANNSPLPPLYPQST